MPNIKLRIGKIAVFIAVVAAIFSIVFFISNYDYKRGNIDQQLNLQNQVDEMLSDKLGGTQFGIEKYSTWASRHNLAVKNDLVNADSDNDELVNYLEYIHGTDPLKADTDSDRFSDRQELINGFDPNDDGKQRLKVRVQIEKIGVDVPMVWSSSDNNNAALRDLENGVSHFYKTAAPGQKGNMIISGHSSNYVWAKGDYNSIFKDLDNMEVGDVVLVNTYQVNGRMVAYKYVVSNKFVTTADDQRVFLQPETPTLTLSTCWPIGTNFKRLIVQAQIEK